MRIQTLGQDYNIGNILKNYINEVIANYQAKIGKFLQQKQQLNLIRNRVIELAKYPETRLPSATLLLEVDNTIGKQIQLEADGKSILSLIDRIQTNPVVIDAIAGRLPPITDPVKWGLLSDTLEQAKRARDSISNWLKELTIHESNIQGLLTRTINLEGQAKGLVPLVPEKMILGIPSKYLVIAIPSIILALKVFKIFGRKRKR